MAKKISKSEAAVIAAFNAASERKCMDSRGILAYVSGWLSNEHPELSAAITKAIDSAEPHDFRNKNK